MSIIKNEFNNYLNSKAKFKQFHNEVINMPRDKFSEMTFFRLKSLSSYLLLISDEIGYKGKNYKEILEIFIEHYKKSNLPPNEFRDISFEDFFDKEYLKDYRKVRHIFGICLFFGLLKTVEGQKKSVNTNVCKALLEIEKGIFHPLLRNLMINININSNDYIKNLNKICIDNSSNYDLTLSILKYIKHINLSKKRNVTLFEISFLLGRVDNLKAGKDIFERAIKIGEELPKNEAKQKEKIFKELGWIETNGNIFKYRNSQAPDFKFKTFILYMQDFGLIKPVKESNKRKFELTSYAHEILQERIPAEIVDLNNLLLEIKNDTVINNRLITQIIHQRNKQLEYALKRKNSEILIELNKMSLRSKSTDRNKLIAELAKLKVNYECQATKKPTFDNTEGLNYVESHHIIEFAESNENGPDIIDNLIVIGPEKHKLIHYGHKDQVEKFYKSLRKKNVINIELFRNMINTYDCLEKKHLEILKNKKIITNKEFNELLKLV